MLAVFLVTDPTGETVTKGEFLLTDAITEAETKTGEQWESLEAKGYAIFHCSLKIEGVIGESSLTEVKVTPAQRDQYLSILEFRLAQEQENSRTSLTTAAKAFDNVKQRLIAAKGYIDQLHGATGLILAKSNWTRKKGGVLFHGVDPVQELSMVLVNAPDLDCPDCGKKEVKEGPHGKH